MLPYGITRPQWVNKSGLEFIFSFVTLNHNMMSYESACWNHGMYGFKTWISFETTLNFTVSLSLRDFFHAFPIFDADTGFYTKGLPLVKSNLICPSDKLSWQPGCPVLKHQYTRKFLYQPRKWLFGQPANKLGVDPCDRCFAFLGLFSIYSQARSQWMFLPLQWCHNEWGGISNHQRFDCLLNCLIRRKSKKTSKLCVTGFCVGNSPVTGEFPAQRDSNLENVSIIWRHHDLQITFFIWHEKSVFCVNILKIYILMVPRIFILEFLWHTVLDFLCFCL